VEGSSQGEGGELSLKMTLRDGDIWLKEKRVKKLHRKGREGKKICVGGKGKVGIFNEVRRKWLGMKRRMSTLLGAG